MLSSITEYAIAKGLPYEFVEWALDNYGHEVDNSTDFDAISSDWWNTTNLGIKDLK